jgi:hypothetical protein
MPRLSPAWWPQRYLQLAAPLAASWGGDSARCRKSVARNEKLYPHRKGLLLATTVSPCLSPWLLRLWLPLLWLRLLSTIRLLPTLSLLWLRLLPALSLLWVAMAGATRLAARSP